MNMTTKNAFCKKCRLHLKAKHPQILGRGNINASILLLGEGPGKTEDDKGQVFIGKSGRLLQNRLEALNLDCFISNAVLCRCVDKLGENATPTATQIELCLPTTIDLILTMKPKVVVALGAIAMNQLLRFSMNMEVSRGKTFYHSQLDIIILPTYHPSYLLRTNDTRYMKEFESDLVLAKQLSMAPKPRRIQSVPASFKDRFTIEKYLKELKDSSAFTVDIETTGLNPKVDRITDISFCSSAGDGAHIEWKYLADQPDLLTLLKETLSSPAEKVFHNADFDIRFLRSIGIDVTGTVFDTMLAYHMITMSYEGGKARSLYRLKTMAWFLTQEGGYESVLEEFGGIVGVQEKEQGLECATTAKKKKKEDNQGLLFDDYDLFSSFGFDPEYNARLIYCSEYVENARKEILNSFKIGHKAFYSAMDADVTFRIYRYLKRIIDEKYSYAFYNITMPLCKTLIRVHENGILLDIPYINKLIEENNIVSDSVTKEFFKEVKCEFNINSTEQLRDFMYGKLKLPINGKFMTKGKLASTDEEAILFYSEKKPILKKILEYREVNKQTTTYLEGFKKFADENGRIYPSYFQIGTASGRLSCIAEGTKILVVGGEKNIEDIFPGDLVYCYDNDGKVRISEVLNKFYNGLRETLKIKWQSNGCRDLGELIVTPEHLVKTKYKGWVQAKDLKRYDKLVHLKKRKQSNGRVRLYGTNCYMEYEEVCIKREYYKASSEKHIHHKDFSKDNNNVFNLEVLNREQHASVHHKKRMQQGTINYEHIRHCKRQRYIGTKNPCWIELSKEELIEMLHVARGHPTKVPMDFETFKRKCKEKDVNIKEIASLYSSKGILLTENSVATAIYKYSGRRNPLGSAARELGVGYYKLKRLCESYGISYNHMLASLKPNGVRCVWDLEIKDYHNFISNEICTHNCTNPNLQNIPKDNRIRNMVIPAPGHKIVLADLCLAEGTLITTRRGNIPIEQVTTDDSVRQEDGSFKKVTNVFFRGVKEVVTLTTELGYSIELTKHHRLRVIDADGNYVWKRVGELSELDYVAIQPHVIRSNKRIKLNSIEYTHFSNKKINNIPKYMTEDFCEFLGFMCGNGTFGVPYMALRWAVCDKDKDTNDYLKILFKRIFNERIRESTQYRGIFDSRFCSKPLIKYLLNIGLSKERVPKFLFEADSKLICAWLRGFFESDGSVGGRVSCSSSRRTLIEDIQKLLLSVGIISNIWQYKYEKQGKQFEADLLSIKSYWTDVFYKKIGFIGKRKNSILKVLVGKTKKNPTYGRHPNLGKKSKKYTYIDELKNTRNRGGFVSIKTAKELKIKYPDVYTELGLNKITDWGQIYVKCNIDEKISVKVKTYDIEVEETHSFIANGFVSHNSQVELRILAMISGDTNMINAFKSGHDFHTYTACSMFGIPLDQFDKKITEHNNKRDAAKTINFGVVYQQRAESLAESLKILVEQAHSFMDKFFSAYPKVSVWIGQIKQFARTHGYVETIYGRRRYLPNIKSSDMFVREGAERQAVNSPVQSTAGDVCFIGMIRFQKWLDENNKKTKIIGTVHDSILAEAPLDEVEEISVVLPKIMTTDIPRITIEIKADVDILDRWGK